MKNPSAVELGKQSVKKRHARLRKQGVDISEYYRELRKKGNKTGVLTSVR